MTSPASTRDDVIAFGMYAGIPARVEGIEFLIMKEGEALFKLEDDDVPTA